MSRIIPFFAPNVFLSPQNTPTGLVYIDTFAKASGAKQALARLQQAFRALKPKVEVVGNAAVAPGPDQVEFPISVALGVVSRSTFSFTFQEPQQLPMIEPLSLLRYLYERVLVRQREREVFLRQQQQAQIFAQQQQQFLLQNQAQEAEQAGQENVEMVEEEQEA